MSHTPDYFAQLESIRKQIAEARVGLKESQTCLEQSKAGIEETRTLIQMTRDHIRSSQVMIARDICSEVLISRLQLLQAKGGRIT